MITHRYSNGLWLVHQSMPHSELCVVQVYVQIGSAFETKKAKGISHSLEHMIFQGTKTRKSSDIYSELDFLGMDINAYTTKRFSCFTFKCGEQNMEKGIDLLGDMIFNSNFSQQDYDNESKVIHEENTKDENDVRRNSYQKFSYLIYNGTSFMFPVDETDFHDKPFDLRTLNQWYKWFYQPNKIVVSVVCPLPFDKLETMISESLFAKKQNFMESKPPLHALLSTRPPSNVKDDKIQFMTNKVPGMNNANIMIGFRINGYFSSEKYIFILLTEMFNGMTGLLFSKLRQETGLTYRIFAEVDFEEYNGYFAVNIETSNKNIFPSEGVLPIMIGIFRSLIDRGITATQLQIAKERQHTKQLVKFENVSNICEYNGTNVLIQAPFVSYEKEFATHYQPIRVKDVDMIIKKYFFLENLFCSIMSNSPPPLEKLESACNKLRL